MNNIYKNQLNSNKQNKSTPNLNQQKSNKTRTKHDQLPNNPPLILV